MRDFEDNTYIIGGPTPSETLPKISLGQLYYDNLLCNPSNDVAFVDVETKEKITFGEILDLTVQLATALSKYGVGKNSCIAICSENHIHYYLPIISSLYVGATVTTFNPAYTERELDHTLNISRPSLIFCSKTVLPRLLNLKKKLNFIEKIITINGKNSYEDSLSMLDIIRDIKRKHIIPRTFNVTEADVDNDVAFILYSSGTTGLPKGVMITHTNLHTRFLHSRDPRYHQYPKLPRRTILGVLPMFHGFGLITGLEHLLLHHQIAVMKKFNEKLFLSTIEEYKVSILLIAPPLAVFLAKSPLVSKYDISCVQEILCGSAPLGKETEDLLKKRLRVKHIRQGYGLTETTLAVLMMEYNEYKQGSVGRVISYMKCKVRDPETGKSLGPGKLGELCFKGPMVMKGYYRNVKATKDTFTTDGWLRSGDLGYYDEDSLFFIVDRLKELIKYKGFQVAPAELEAILLSHPEVRDAAVIGLPNEDSGELPMAFVVKMANGGVTEEELEAFVASKVSSQKKLRGGVIFINAIPKSVSGKILRRELKIRLMQITSKL